MRKINGYPNPWFYGYMFQVVFCLVHLGSQIDRGLKGKANLSNFNRFGYLELEKR